MQDRSTEAALAAPFDFFVNREERLLGDVGLGFAMVLLVGRHKYLVILW